MYPAVLLIYFISAADILLASLAFIRLGNIITRVKLATLVRRPPVKIGRIFTEPASLYDIIHGRYSITWLPVYFECWSHFLE